MRQLRSLVQVLSFDVASKVLWGVAGIVLIRFMTEPQFARYTLGISLASIATQVLAASFNRIYIIGHERLGLTGASSFLGFELMVIVSATVLSLPLRNFASGMYWYVAAVVCANCLADFLRTLYQRDLEFLRLSLFELGKAVALSTALVILVRTRGYNLSAGDVLATQAIVVLAASLAILIGRVRWSDLRKPAGAILVAKQVMQGKYRYLFAYFILLALFSQIDVIMLRGLAGSLELATYGAAFRYYTVLLLALSAVHVVLLPLVQNTRTHSELMSIFDKHRETLSLFVAIIVFVAWVGQWLIPWVDGGKYPETVLVFRVLAISAVISFAFSPHANLVIVSEDFRYLFGLIVLGLACGIVLNGLLIPRLGATGAALATLISFGLVNGLIFLRARRYMMKSRMQEYQESI